MNNYIKETSNDIEIDNTNQLQLGKLKILNMYFKKNLINEIKFIEQVFFKIKYNDNLWLKYTCFNKRIFRSYFVVMYYRNKKFIAPLKYRDKNEIKQLVVFINKNSECLI